MKRARQTCALCGQTIKEPKTAPDPEQAGLADKVRAVREATERRNQEGSTGTRDAMEGGALAAQRRRQR